MLNGYSKNYKGRQIGGNNDKIRIYWVIRVYGLHVFYGRATCLGGMETEPRSEKNGKAGDITMDEKTIVAFIIAVALMPPLFLIALVAKILMGGEDGRE